MRTKDMKTGTVAVTGRGFSNHVVVIVRPETWSLERNNFGKRSVKFSKGKSSRYRADSGVLAIETPIHTGSSGYFYEVDPEEKSIKKQIDRAVAEAHRLAALSDDELIAELNAGSSVPSGKYGKVSAIVPSNITHTIEQFVIESTAQRASRERERARFEEVKNADASTKESIASSFKALGFDAYFSVDGNKLTILRAQDFANILAELAKEK